MKIHLFLGSLSSSRNHARSPPDGLLTRLPDFQKNCHGNKDAYVFFPPLESLNSEVYCIKKDDIYPGIQNMID